jgi:hypothetical protein
MCLDSSTVLLTARASNSSRASRCCYVWWCLLAADCGSGLVPYVVVVAGPMQFESGLPKQLMQWVVSCPHTRECMGNSTKRYVGSASADSTLLWLQLSLSASGL